MPQQLFGVLGRKAVLVHHDAGGEADGAAGNRPHGQARGSIFCSCHRRHQALAVDQRDQMLDHQVSDDSVALGGRPAEPPVGNDPRVRRVTGPRHDPERGEQHRIRTAEVSRRSPRTISRAGRVSDPEQRLRSVGQLDLAAISEVRDAGSGQARERHNRIVRPTEPAERADQPGTARRRHVVSVPEESIEVSPRRV
jgi:hypothetical protein